jgi:hypothetical protein
MGRFLLNFRYATMPGMTFPFSIEGRRAPTMKLGRRIAAPPQTRIANRAALADTGLP